MTWGSSDYTDNPEKRKTDTFADELSETELSGAETEAADSFKTELSAEEKLKLELAELKDKYIRLYADFENFRRRTAKERLELLGTANADLMKTILPIVDDFERATQSFDATTEVQPLKEGVALIHNKLYKTLEAKGLKAMKTVGLPFDAELHESIAQYPAPSEELKGKVVDEVEKGYFLNDKVIRYAKVVVGA
ncbi:nucleotide exchange factor GrpE [Cytophagaceae bacterium SJW1-29]|uniref:Protein GrpE n=2 Tax=Salmonirosea aquatica TaxID=2654236 RepID=A0A7C9FF06_9BACT|nr:nucleotide exchange factor GrpE [Cytophagaceae bacterium SJW1-29]